LGLQYSGDFKDLSFQPGFFVNYSGLGYNNPASTAVGRGGLAYGTTLRKSFWKGKLTTYSRFSRRSSQTGLETFQRFVQVQNALGLKYSLNQKVKVGLDWTTARMQKGKGHNATPLYASDRVNTSLSFRGKLRSRLFFQYIALGYQNLLTPGQPLSTSGKLLWVTGSSSLSFSRGTLFTTLQLYNTLQRKAAAGNLATLESGWSYQLFKTVSLSTSVLYLDQGITTRQLGIKQSVTTLISRKISVNLFGDLTGNLKPNLNPLLFPNSRGELQIAYKLN